MEAGGALPLLDELDPGVDALRALGRFPGADAQIQGDPHPLLPIGADDGDEDAVVVDHLGDDIQPAPEVFEEGRQERGVADAQLGHGCRIIAADPSLGARRSSGVDKPLAQCAAIPREQG
jgi:hypothetical protein